MAPGQTPPPRAALQGWGWGVTPVITTALGPELQATWPGRRSLAEAWAGRARPWEPRDLGLCWPEGQKPAITASILPVASPEVDLPEGPALWPPEWLRAMGSLLPLVLLICSFRICKLLRPCKKKITRN